MKIDIKLINKIYITSDTHFHQKNICRGVSSWARDSDRIEGNELSTRDFDTLEAMDKAIVDNINSIVPKDAILFHLGDWSFGGEEQIFAFRSRLHVQTIHLITGNHDHHQEKRSSNSATGKWDFLYSSVQKYLELELGNHKFVLFHYPIKSWNHVRKGAFHLHGHQHWKGDLKFGNGRMMDVGMDGNDLKPYKLTDVIELLKDRKFVDENDHHSQK